jgi:hypothetical protein
LRLAADRDLHTSVNLLTYPGFTDCPSEVDALIDFFRRCRVQMVQIRTLSMDRELLEEKVGFPREQPLGVDVLLHRIEAELPGVRLGSHTPYVGRACAYVS